MAHDDLQHGYRNEVGRTGSGLFLVVDTETWCKHCQKWVRSTQFLRGHLEGQCRRKG
jgi:hypothetical protein